jgi:hypothetical protein
LVVLAKEAKGSGTFFAEWNPNMAENWEILPENEAKTNPKRTQKGAETKPIRAARGTQSSHVGFLVDRSLLDALTYTQS